LNRKSENKEASLKGTALHYILEAFDPSDDFELIGFPELEESKLRFIISQLRSMAAEGWTIYAREAWFENAMICGTVDLILYHAETDEYAILDYKTGLKSVEPESAQLAGYAHLFMENKRGVRGVFCGVIQHNNEVDAINLDKKEAEFRLGEILHGNNIKVNENCQYCARLTRCSEFKKSEKTFLDGGFDLVEARNLVPALEAKIEEVKKIVTEKLKAGEEVEGYMLSHRTTKTVNPMAYTLIIDQVGLSALIQKEAIKISNCDLIPAMHIMESVSEFARKGKKK
jgi:hypothetical protein